MSRTPRVYWVQGAGGSLSREQRQVGDSLVSALGESGVEVTPAALDWRRLAVQLYDGPALVLLDLQGAPSHSAASPVWPSAARWLPVLALAAPEVDVPPGALRMVPDQALTALVRHTLDVLREPANLRRHPRAWLDCPVESAELGAGELLDASPHLARFKFQSLPASGQSFSVQVRLRDESRLSLSCEVRAERAGEVVARCRPRTDDDLLLWVHLVLDALLDSPLHRTAEGDWAAGDAAGLWPEDE